MPAGCFFFAYSLILTVKKDAYLPPHNLDSVHPKVGRRALLRKGPSAVPAAGRRRPGAASWGHHGPRRPARARAPNFPGGGRSAGAEPSLARLLPSLGAAEKSPRPAGRRGARGAAETGAGRADSEPRGRAGAAARGPPPPAPRGAHPGSGPQAAIRRGRARRLLAPEPDRGLSARRGPRGAAASGWRRRPRSERAPPRAPGAEQSCPGPASGGGGASDASARPPGGSRRGPRGRRRVRARGARGAARKRRRGALPPPARPPPASPGSPPPPEPRRLRARLPNSQRPSQVYFARNSPRRAPRRSPRSARPACCARAGAPRPPPRGPSPCSGAPSGGGRSSSDLRCWGLACLRRDMLLAARGPGAGQRHQRGGRRGRRGARMGPGN